MKIFYENESALSKELSLFLQEEETSNIEVEKSLINIKESFLKDDFKTLQECSKKFDNYELTPSNYRVKDEEIDNLAKNIDPKIEASLSIAVERVKKFHKKQLEKRFEFIDTDGNRMGQKITPLDSVAVYVPGGRALYPSTVYMSIIPAIIAGVKRIVLFSPPKTFETSSEVAYLIKLFGIKECYRIGGAGAIFSAAYGFNGVAPVDKIVGPGNIYVATAKRMVYGKVSIDMIAGPSEILVIADTKEEKDISIVASDLLSQAEHDPNARSILIGFDESYVKKIMDKTLNLANELTETKNSAIESLQKKGTFIVVPNMETAIAISNRIAPEHLELYSDNPYEILKDINNAGSIFLGKNTPESVGDYIGGPNHILPTSGTARFFSPLGVYDFVKRSSYIEFTRESIIKYGENIANIAEKEKLLAHKRAVTIRLS